MSRTALAVAWRGSRERMCSAFASLSYRTTTPGISSTQRLRRRSKTMKP
jgi:hypothetical protein